jgi:AsmA protein
MSRLSKVLIGIAALAVVLLGLALAAPALIDQDALKQRIETAVLIASGQRLRIDGDIDLRLLPRPSVELGPLELGGVDGSPAPVRIGRLRLEPDPWPLLIGDLRLERVVVDAVQLRLPPPNPPPPSPAPAAAEARTPAAGTQPSRQGELPRASVAIDAPPGAVAPPAGVVLPPLPPIRELLIRDFALRWQDPATGAVVEVQDGELRAGPLAPGQDGLIEGRLTLSGERPRLAGELTLSATLRPAADLSVIRVAPLHLTGDALAFGSVQGPPLTLDAGLTWRPLDGSLAIDDIRTASAGLATTGNALLVLPPRPDAPALTGQIEMPAGDLRAWLEAAGIAPLPGGPQGLRRVGGSARFALAGGGLSLTGVRLQLDDTRAAGAARLGMHWGARPAGVAALTLDRLDLDRYLGIPPAAGARASSAGPAGAPTAPAADPPLPEPAGALTLGLSAGELRAGRLVYGDLTALGVLNAADWWADLAAADVYAGRIQGRLAGNLPAPHAPLALTLAATAEDIRIEPLLADAAGQAPVTGRGGFALDLAARGADAMALRRSLAGAVSLSLRDGDLTGFDIGRLIGAGGNDAARFATLTMSARGEKGVFRSDDLSARSPLMHLDGGGAIDVASEVLDLDLQAVLVEPPNGAGIRELEGVPIPIRVSGHWARPSWQVDVAAALRAAARRALDERVNGRGSWLDKLEERTGIPGLRDGLEQGLRGLFGQ